MSRAPRPGTGPRSAFRLVLEYDGSRYMGWQRQGEGQTRAGVRTVAGTLERVLREAGLTVLTLGGSGRTDAGVHALGQVAHLHLGPGAPSPKELRRLLDEGLPHDVALRELAPCGPAFHARHDARSRSYLYQLSLRRSALAKPYLWWVKGALDLARLEETWRLFEGFHDVSAFADLEREDPRCEVQACELAREGSLVLLRVTASHFLRRQVRRMVGAAVWCGLGRERPARVARDLARPSEAATLFWSDKAAPSAGLFLEHVQYDGAPERPALAPLVRVP